MLHERWGGIPEDWLTDRLSSHPARVGMRFPFKSGDPPLASDPQEARRHRDLDLSISDATVPRRVLPAYTTQFRYRLLMLPQEVRLVGVGSPSEGENRSKARPIPLVFVPTKVIRIA
jgi:hypothetical protein